ncbi:MAG: tRNA-dihydrouridine synthase family protein [Paludibacteraceae bacterium]|nr:tRNA-dihydrouridine synthase family protein [Paludibacteraceae bacterium]
MTLPIHFAPIQGLTDSAYCRIHQRIFGGVDVYYTPFIRLEHGAPRSKDVREAMPIDKLNRVPQIIANSADEAKQLVDILVEQGHQRVDINLGCPFPLQTKKGRGAALLADVDKCKDVLAVVNAYPDVRFSLKMRLGMTDAKECLALLPVINDLPLAHVAVHARVAAMQYGGEPMMDDFAEFAKGLRQPVIYNGDIKSVDDANRVAEQFPSLVALMIGRGLSERPTLAAEIKMGTEMPQAERMVKIGQFHRDCYAHYSTALTGGDAQIVMKMKTWWEPLEAEIGHKAYKAIKKAGSLSSYLSAASNAVRW